MKFSCPNCQLGAIHPRALTEVGEFRPKPRFVKILAASVVPTIIYRKALSFKL